MICYIGEKITWEYTKFKIMNNMLVYVNPNIFPVRSLMGMLLRRADNLTEVSDIENTINEFIRSLSEICEESLYPEFYDVKVINNNSKIISVCVLDKFFLPKEFKAFCERSSEILTIESLDDYNFLVSEAVKDNKQNQIILNDDDVRIMILSGRWYTITK